MGLITGLKNPITRQVIFHWDTCCFCDEHAKLNIMEITMQLEGDEEGCKTILMDPIAIDEPPYMVNSDEIEVAMIAFDEATQSRS